MKKIIVLLASVFAMSTFNAFAIVEATEISNSVTNCINSETVASAPVYWSGWARHNSNRIYIKVYRSENMCDSFYAEASIHEIYSPNGPNRRMDINETLVVKSNKDWYYVTYDGGNYYFTM
ncbi:MAG: hypothetical protein E7080_02675 [Bacteroidales bacterium]|nr:hypothetical protein [Bacteroidales bacterium]